MYANFGFTGGIIGCGAYALFFGPALSRGLWRALSNPLWWSFVPFIFYAAVKAEDDIAFVLNWTTKSVVVLVGILLFLPHLRRALFAHRNQGIGLAAVSPLDSNRAKPRGILGS
jgi:hypothetical protein